MITQQSDGFDSKYLDLLATLEVILDLGGKVCENYEECSHVACESSYLTWTIADKVLEENIIPWDGNRDVLDYCAAKRNSLMSTSTNIIQFFKRGE